jgi:hypothetical protein
MFPSSGRLRILYQTIFTEEKPVLILALEGSSKMLWLLREHIQTRILRGITSNLLEARAESNTETTARNE